MDEKFKIEVGDSIEIEDANGKHLHFIVAEASKTDHSSVILVYMSSKNTVYKDATTIIRFGEHPYITDPEAESWIRYQNTKFFSRECILPLITKYYGKISEELLHRIQIGLENSPKVEKGIKKIYLEWKMNKLFDSLK